MIPLKHLLAFNAGVYPVAQPDNPRIINTKRALIKNCEEHQN